ncbi:uracil-DNA glycosylase [Paenibacillus sp. Y412MC10]|uniref:uracil-DNA glycosylase n=1 Tax=Geobacillus sp. (strain Y412MC10) TaxID=481743 RepID=UPI0011A4614C|nr:uracil-DNA glycosylase [Paenibacillus sp. Y412MC10]
MAILKNDWATYLEQEFTKPYYLQLREFLIEEYRTKTIFPDKYDIFNALHYTPLADTKVVILGQDPYHGPGQAPHEANSHKNRGWESFTDKVIETINRKNEPVVFLLWGSHAQKKAELITNRQHKLIRSPHPSPLSAHRGFFGSKPFSRANEFLRSMGLQEVDWQIPNL